MASMQKSREERARSAAQKAADELAASRGDQHHQQVHETTTPDSPRGGGGILSSVQESARNVMGAIRGTFSGTDDDGGGSTAARGGATSADKTKAAVERAKEYAVETKEGARLALAGDAVARKGETDESAWQQGQDVRRRAAEKAQEEARRVREPSEEKGRAATENIFGMAKGMMAGSTLADKMVMPTDVEERKRAEAVAGGGWHGKAAEGNREPDEEYDVMLRVKAADQMTGQALNDVGKIDEEGTGMPRRR